MQSCLRNCSAGADGAQAPGADITETGTGFGRLGRGRTGVAQRAVPDPPCTRAHARTRQRDRAEDAEENPPEHKRARTGAAAPPAAVGGPGSPRALAHAETDEARRVLTDALHAGGDRHLVEVMEGMPRTAATSRALRRVAPLFLYHGLTQALEYYLVDYLGGDEMSIQEFFPLMALDNGRRVTDLAAALARRLPPKRRAALARAAILRDNVPLLERMAFKGCIGGAAQTKSLLLYAVAMGSMHAAAFLGRRDGGWSDRTTLAAAVAVAARTEDPLDARVRELCAAGAAACTADDVLEGNRALYAFDQKALPEEEIHDFVERVRLHWPTPQEPGVPGAADA